jgi:hypothetical protein
MEMHKLFGRHLNTLTFRTDLAVDNAPPQPVEGNLEVVGVRTFDDHPLARRRVLETQAHRV